MVKGVQGAGALRRIGQVDQKQIDAWKTQFDVVDIIEIEVAQEGTEEISYFYLKPAGRDALALIMSRYDSGQIVEAGEAAIANCWILGDERIRNPAGIRQERTAVRAAQLAYASVNLPAGQVKKK